MASADAVAAYQYFVGKGLSPGAAAGLVGNLIAESGVNPESVQSGGPGRGIAQWSEGGRWQPSLMTGNVSQDLQNQLNYVWQELNGPYKSVLTQLQGTTDVNTATTIVETQYERPAVDNTSARIADAETVLGKKSSGGSSIWSLLAPLGGVVGIVAGGGGSSLISPLGSVGKAVVTGSNPVSSAVDSVAKDILGPLVTKTWWLRVGEFMVGLLVAIIGMFWLFHKEAGDLASTVGKAAKIGAMV